MTREEEIRIASVDNADKRLTEVHNLSFAINAVADYDNGLTLGFNDGANWQYHEFINKACEWMNCIDFEMEYQYNDDDGYTFFDADKFIEDFRKAMEE